MGTDGVDMVVAQNIHHGSCEPPSLVGIVEPLEGWTQASLYGPCESFYIAPMSFQLTEKIDCSSRRDQTVSL